MTTIVRGIGRVNLRGLVKFFQDNNTPLPPILTSWDEFVLTGSDSTTSELTGFSVDISKDGNWLALGAPGNGNDDTSNENNFIGAVYLFNWNGTAWIETQKITNPDGIENSANFGYSVSLNSNGTILAIGTPFPFDTSGTLGKVFTYTRTALNFSFTQKVLPNQFQINSFYGQSVSLDNAGTTLVVGKISSFSALSPGNAYIYNWNGTTWALQDNPSGTGMSINSDFGNSVDINGVGNIIVVGAPGSDASKAFVFRNNGIAWIEEQILSGSDTDLSDKFGNNISVSTDGNYIAVGAPDHDGNSLTDNGAVYIFKWNGVNWIEEAKLAAADEIDDMRFGYSVSLDQTGSRIAIGARFNMSDFSGSDTANRGLYIFNRSGTVWSQELKLQPGAPLELFGFDYREFGNAVSISDSGLRVAVGAPDPGIVEGAASDQGRVHVFHDNT